MKVYVSHSTSYDFQNQLYLPLRQSHLNDEYELILPHEFSSNLFSSKEFFKSKCDIVLAEISESKMGVGIELGWADAFDVPIIGIHRSDVKPPRSAVSMCKIVLPYTESTLVEIVEKGLKS